MPPAELLLLYLWIAIIFKGNLALCAEPFIEFSIFFLLTTPPPTHTHLVLDLRLVLCGGSSPLIMESGQVLIILSWPCMLGMLLLGPHPAHCKQLRLQFSSEDKCKDEAALCLLWWPCNWQPPPTASHPKSVSANNSVCFVTRSTTTQFREAKM